MRFVQFIIRVQQALLSGVHRLLFAGPGRRRVPQRILFLRMGGIGDFLFAVPAIAIARRRFPKSEILLLTGLSTNPEMAGTASRYTGGKANLPWLQFICPSLVDKVLIYPNLRPDLSARELRPIISKFDPDLSFILSYPGDSFGTLLKKMLFLRFVGVKGELFGWRKKASYAFFRKVQDRAGQFEHHIFGPIRALEESQAIGPVSEKEIEFPLAVSAPNEDWAKEFIAQQGLLDRKIIAIAPGSLRAHKQWPIQNFIELGRRILSDPDVTLLVMGTVQDDKLASMMLNAFPGRCVSAVGKADIPRAAALFKRCRCLVGNDGGAVHLANAVLCPCVTISNSIQVAGSIEPWFSREYSIRHDVECSPCYSQTYCPRGVNVCVTEIGIDEVFERCQQLFQSIDSDHRLTAVRRERSAGSA